MIKGKNKELKFKAKQLYFQVIINFKGKFYF